jgi:hypothetical protein
MLAAPAQAQSWRTLTSARQLWGSEPVEVDIEYGAGELEINRAPSGGMLYRMEMRYDEDQTTPVAEFDSSARILKLGSRNRHNSGRRVREGSTVDVTLTDRVPLDLALHFGAGEARLELGGLRIRNLDVETGASKTSIRFDSPNPIRAQEVQLKAGAAELTVTGLGNVRAERFSFQGGVGSTTLDFGGAWGGNATAKVQMGMGSVVLRFPRSVGVRITRSSFLTSFEADRMVRRDGSYFSENWEQADHQLTIDLEAALGSIEVVWIDG